jgi:hypothetical protein
MTLKQRKNKPKRFNGAASRSMGSIVPEKVAAIPGLSSKHSRAPLGLPFSNDIPSLYNETYLRMIPRDPYHVFSFWEIAGDDLKKNPVVSPYGVGDSVPPQQVLRLYSLGAPKSGSGERRLDDIAVSPGTTSRYVCVPESGRSYKMELGFVTSSDGYVTLCQSNEVAMPEARVGKASLNETLSQSGPTVIATQKLIDFSLCSGKVIQESGNRPRPDQEPPVINKSDQAAVGRPNAADEPSIVAQPLKGTTVSSWNTPFPVRKAAVE